MDPRSIDAAPGNLPPRVPDRNPSFTLFHLSSDAMLCLNKSAMYLRIAGRRSRAEADDKYSKAVRSSNDTTRLICLQRRSERLTLSQVRCQVGNRVIA